MNTIFTRRSIRNFTHQVVEREKIDKLLRAAMQAPSAGNQQPWEFIVVQDKTTLEKLGGLSPYAKPAAKAPLAFVLVAREEGLRFPEYWEQDMSAATQNILLEAVELGLGAVWLGAAPVKERMDYLREMFNLPEKIKPFCVIALGYPAPGQENRFVDRFEASRVHYEKW